MKVDLVAGCRRLHALSRVMVALAAVVAVACSAPAGRLRLDPASPFDSPPSVRPDRSGVIGEWQGTLRPPGGSLRLRVAIFGTDGTLAAEVVSIDQGNAVVPVSRVVRLGARLHLELRAVGAEYDGVIQQGPYGDEIAGTFKQGELDMPLTLRRATGEPPLNRPQEPRRPFPYREEAVRFENRAASASFAATLTLPHGRGPFPAVVLLTGSGPQDRDESVFGHKPFLLLADALTRRGVAVLRADDRGVGGSRGDPNAPTTELASDALAGVAYLRERPEVDGKRIGLLGHSEGATVATIAAARTPELAFVVLLAPPSVAGDELLLLQGRRLLALAGADEVASAEYHARQEEIFAAIEASDTEVARRRVKQLLRTAMPLATDRDIEVRARELTGPWFKAFLTLDPRDSLQAVSAPLLAVFGELDAQVPVEENERALRQALEGGPRRDVSIRRLPGLNHLLQRCQTGAPSEYSIVEETMAPAALSLIVDWVADQTGAGR